MTNRGPSKKLLTIGEFAARTRLTVKALRVYDDHGVLAPAEVDPRNGYRRYTTDQIYTARLIGLLRGADLGLTGITRVLAELETGTGQAGELLDEHLRSLEATYSARRILIRHIHAVIRHKEPSMFTIHTRHVAAQRVMSIQRRLHGDQTDAFVREAKIAFTEHLAGREPTGPFTLVFHGPVDDDNDGPLEAIMGCGEDIAPTDTIGIRTEPAHDEAFTPITKAQWDYPAILAAYDAVACSPEAQQHPGSHLSCREVYCAEPDDITDDDLICDIAFPRG